MMYTLPAILPPVMDEAWADLVHSVSRPGNIDLLYLSYEEAKGKAEKGTRFRISV